MNRTIDAVIAGYLGVDLVCDFKNAGLLQLIRPGQLFEMKGIELALGGVVANTGMAMKKFGRQVYLNGLTGNDALGRMAKSVLEEYGIGEGISQTGSAGTACGIVMAAPGMDRIFFEYPGCNRFFGLSAVHLEAVACCRLFHFGYPPLLREVYLNNGRGLLEIFTAARDAGAVTSLDFSLPDRESESGSIDWLHILHNCLPLVDIFLPSIEEALQVLMPDQYAALLAEGDETLVDRVPLRLVRQLGKMILDAGAAIALVKLAHRGIYMITGDCAAINRGRGFQLAADRWNYRELHCHAYPLETERVKNASGAGDTAVAAFLTALLDNEPPETAIRLAAMAGRNNLYCLDILEELTGWPEMQQALGSGPVPLLTDFRSAGTCGRE